MENERIGSSESQVLGMSHHGMGGSGIKVEIGAA